MEPYDTETRPWRLDIHTELSDETERHEEQHQRPPATAVPTKTETSERI